MPNSLSYGPALLLGDTTHETTHETTLAVIRFQTRLIRPVLVVAAFSALGLLACGRSHDGPPICDDCNVVLIVADTLRADHLASYGYHRVTTPFFDQLAESGVLFEQARAPSSCTFPSVNSLLTSRHPSVFLRKATRPAIPTDVLSLPEILQEHGYKTAAVSASPIVRATPSNHNAIGGFGAGFDVFDEACEWIDGGCVASQSAALLDRELRKGPFFLYLHFLDPHDPYQSPRNFGGTFAGDYDGPHEFIAEGDPNTVSKLIRDGRFDDMLDVERDMGHFKDLYDEGIRSFDEGLKEVVEHLESRRLLDKTVIVVTSDHGESFYEHGRVKHCQTLHDTEIHVPLWIRVPGVSQSGRTALTTPLVDLAPTLLDMLGLPTPGVLEGRSLRPWIEEPTTPGDGTAYSAYSVLRSVTDGRYKLITSVRDKGEDRLYDLQDDPGETHSLHDAERRTLHRLRKLLADWMSRTEGGKNAEQKQKEADEIEKELRSVGYIG